MNQLEQLTIEAWRLYCRLRYVAVNDALVRRAYGRFARRHHRLAEAGGRFGVIESSKIALDAWDNTGPKVPELWYGDSSRND